MEDRSDGVDEDEACLRCAFHQGLPLLERRELGAFGPGDKRLSLPEGGTERRLVSRRDEGGVTALQADPRRRNPSSSPCSARGPSFSLWEKFEPTAA